MPTVRTSCPTCDSVIIDATAITLRRRSVATDVECDFVCPECCERVVQPISEKMVPVLIGAGCTVDPWGDSAALLHPSLTGAITEDEIHEFVAALESDDWLAELHA